MLNIIILYSIVSIIIINIFWVFGFFVKLVGVETKRWSTTNSIFQIINLIPRTIGIFQIPLITLYTETAINNRVPISILFFQGLIVFNFIGVFIGIILLPLFLGILQNIIKSVYENSSFNVLLNKDLWKTIDFSIRNFEYKSFYLAVKPLKVNNFKLFTNNLIEILS